MKAYHSRCLKRRKLSSPTNDQSWDCSKNFEETVCLNYELKIFSSAVLIDLSKEERVIYQTYQISRMILFVFLSSASLFFFLVYLYLWMLFIFLELKHNISGRHTCSKCQEDSTIFCYCCPTAVCSGCLDDVHFTLIKGEYGFCHKCKKLALHLENEVNDMIFVYLVSTSFIGD